MARDNLPPDVIRVLSFHGPVEMFVDEGRARARVAVAPFEDVLHLLVPTGSDVERALLRTNTVDVQARHPEGDYALRMTGRAHAGAPLGRHPERASIEPWVPNGATNSTLLAVPFVAEHIEFVRAEGDSKARYHGPTPEATTRPSPGMVLLRACFSGLPLPFAISAAVVPWLWLTLEGPDYPARPLVLVVQICTGLGLLGGARLLVLALAFGQWRKGKARMEDAPLLTEALLAPREAVRLGALFLGLSAIGLAALGSYWDGTAALIALSANGAWLLTPAWTIHLLSGRPEPKT